MIMLERVHLEIVQAVQERGTLTLAAEQLHLTQSALSHSIKKLEQQLGTALWLREGRGLRLTQAGQAVLALARQVLPQFQRAEEQLQQIAHGKKGILRIGMECHPCYRWLQRVLSPFLSAWPEVDLDLKQKAQFDGIAALLNHEIDLLVTPDPLPQESLSFEPVFAYEQVLVVGPGHRLAGAKCVSPQDLREETLLTYPVDPSRLDIFSHFLRPAGVHPRHHKSLETTDILLQLVACGRGITALPRWMLEEYRYRLPLLPLKLGAEGLHKHIYLGSRLSDESLLYLQDFIDTARDQQPSYVS